MNDNRKPGMFQFRNKQNELMEELHNEVARVVGNWREMADNPDVIEGDLRNHLRHATNVIVRLVASHQMQHEIIVRLRHGFYVACGIVALWVVAYFMGWLWPTT
jgi:hypothetical protein